ncbi:MAG: 1-(5-phosphoribosyl)-5-[(5-phosphoribosylamino)methylideneamino]imidazole-4-carboxamide isomerase [Betaproteobacteria bacterium]
MIVIPAIDVRDGRCVRLYQGRPEAETVYAEDPVEVAARWKREGATRLHLVDLDGAFRGCPQILDILAGVAAVGVPVEFGGGLRTLAQIEAALEAGARWVTLGTVAVTSPTLVAEACANWPGRVMVALDARDGQVTIAGWGKDGGVAAAEVGRRVRDVGVTEVIYTDIQRDGTLAGPNVSATRALAKQTGLKVIASGGVGTIADVRHLKEAEPDGVCGVIVGKALYEGTIRLAAALREVS